MVNRVERRDTNIEEMRRKYLECFYDAEKRELDADSMQALGLNMYIRSNGVKKILYDAFCQSNYDRSITMHPQQIECLNYLLRGENVLISAPTSFGKTFVALEYMSRKKFSNIVFVVPTLALMNELFVKIKNKFGDDYNIIQSGYESTEKNNIYIIVPERADVQLLSKIESIDFLVFDEIYKLQRTKNKKSEDKRIISLNRGYFELVNRAKQTLLLGPFIKDIAFERTQLNDNITKYITDYAPVFTQIEFRENKDDFVLDEIEQENSKLIYFTSPNSIYEFATKISRELDLDVEENSLTLWCDKYISNKWLPSEMLKKGIGIHHGKLPGFMRRYIENMYNAKDIKTILCTSTLLEGINTPTSELLVYDSAGLTAFKINNLIGRVGRLNSFKKGQVFLFDKNLEQFLIGDAKYEEISIVAEVGEIVDLEEVIYLGKAEEDLDDENRQTYNQLENFLKNYGKSIEDFKKTDSFVIVEFIRLIEKLDRIIEKTKEFQCVEKKEETRIRSDIIEIFTEIIKYPRGAYMLKEINGNLQHNRVKNAVCINKLLNKVPNSIYGRIKQEVDNNFQIMSSSVLNLFIDYLFDLAFSYIKYDLSRIVLYMDFLFDEEYLNRNKEMKEIYSILNKEVLSRLRIYNFDNNLLLKILIDLDLPYQDAKELSKMLISKINMEKLSTSVVLDKLEEQYEKIVKSKKIDDVTKDLLKILLGK